MRGFFENGNSYEDQGQESLFLILTTDPLSRYLFIS